MSLNESSPQGGVTSSSLYHVFKHLITAWHQVWGVNCLILMEAKLASFRRRKRQKELWMLIKNKLAAMIPFTGNSDRKMDESCTLDMSTEIPRSHNAENDVDSDNNSDYFENSSPQTDEVADKKSVYLKYMLWALYILFWTTCFAIAIELKFGMVYLLLSGLVGIYLNTRTGPRRKDEISAYSVFNKNCESIDGTLKAEQFEREIRYGPTSVR